MKYALTLMPLAISCFVSLAGAQDAPAPVSDALRTIEQRSAKNLVAAVETMPAEKYGFKPTAAQMTVGEVVVHLSEGNDYLCSTISGEAAPKRSEVTAKATKEALVARLKETFQFCEKTLAKVNDSNLAAKVPFFGGRELTRAEVMLATAQDWSDHYSQLATYLRLNGLLPPTAKKG